MRARPVRCPSRRQSLHLHQYDKGAGTLERRKKKSFDWMKRLCATNGDILWDGVDVEEACEEA